MATEQTTCVETWNQTREVLIGADAMESFLEAFGRDADFHQVRGQRDYLDKETGDVLQVADRDEDTYYDPEYNAVWRQQIQANPDRFIEIIGMSHGQHHDILRDFIHSKWTDDDDRLTYAFNAYDGSIGRWKKSVDDEAIHSYYQFRAERIAQLAKDFLTSRGVILHE